MTRRIPKNGFDSGRADREFQFLAQYYEWPEDAGCFLVPDEFQGLLHYEDTDDSDEDDEDDDEPRFRPFFVEFNSNVLTINLLGRILNLQYLNNSEQFWDWLKLNVLSYRSRWQEAERFEILNATIIDNDEYDSLVKSTVDLATVRLEELLEATVSITEVLGVNPHNTVSDTIEEEQFCREWITTTNTKLAEQLKNHRQELLKLRNKELEVCKKLSHTQLMLRASELFNTKRISELLANLRSNGDVQDLQLLKDGFTIVSQPMHYTHQECKHYLGQYELKICFNGTVRVRNVASRPLTDGVKHPVSVIHPHSFINSGELCLGTYYQALQSAVLEGDYYLLALTLLAMLANLDTTDQSARSNLKHFPPHEPGFVYQTSKWYTILTLGRS